MSARGFIIRLVRGATPDTAPKQFEIAGDAAVVGREPQCDVPLSADASVSRRHARIEARDDGTFRVVDLGSANGVWIGERRIADERIAAGQPIRIGDCVLECRTAAADEAPVDPEKTQLLVSRGRPATAPTPQQVLAAAGEPIATDEREADLLDDSGALYYVAAGTLDVFTVTVEGGRALDGRDHFATLGAGQGMPGIAPDRAHGSLFLAVAVGESQVRKISRGELERLSAQPAIAEALTALLGRWVTMAAARGSADDRANAPPPTTFTWESVGSFHDAMCAQMAVAKRRAAADEVERLASKAREADVARASAFDVLGDVLAGSAADDDAAVARSRVEPVLDTCRVLGRALGIEMVAPVDAAGDQGVDAHIAAIATASGFRTRRVALRGQWWRTDAEPLLAQIASGGVVALLPRRRGYVSVDVVNGTEQPITEASAATLAPFATAFSRPLPAGPPRVSGLIRFAVRGMAPDVWMLIALGLLTGALGAVVPLLTGAVIDRAIPQAERGVLVQIVLAMLVVTLANAAFSIVRSVAIVRIESRMDSVLQSAVWSRLLTLPAAFFRRYGAGDLADRAAGVRAIRGLLANSGIAALLGLVGAVAYLGVMFYINVALAVIAVSLTLVLVAVSALGTYLLLRTQRQQLAVSGQIASLLLQLIAGVAKIRLSAAEPHAFRTWARRFAEQKRLSFALGRLDTILATLASGFQLIAPTVLFAAIHNFRSAADPALFTLSTGQFVAFYAAFGTFSAAMLQISQTPLSLLAVVPIYERLQPILSEPPETDRAKAQPGRLTGQIAVSHLHFRYREDGPWVLKDVTLSIQPGEFVALVGPSGCGKSTLLRLLLGFERPTSGAVLYDGIDLAQIDLRALRQQLGVVLQDGRLLPTDIFRNIVGSSARTIDEAWEAAELAGIADDIREMPMRMNTIVAEGGRTFSGGQRQRLLVARALVAKPRMLFFDEATSALDNQAQAIVTRSLKTLNSARVVIAHRLSTLVDADRIIYLDDGRIQEEGSYAALMAKGGLFAQLAKRQIA